jgi:hypothetical protein
MAIVEVHKIEDKARIYSSDGAVYEVEDGYDGCPTIRVLEINNGYQRSTFQIECDDQIKRYRRALENICYYESLGRENAISDLK